MRGAKPCSGQRLLDSWMLCSLEQRLQVDLNSSHSSWSQARGTRRQAALTVLAATAGIAGWTQAGSRGGIAAGVVRTLGTYLLAALAPAAVRASCSVGREREGTQALGSQPRRKGGPSVFWCPAARPLSRSRSCFTQSTGFCLAICGY